MIQTKGLIEIAGIISVILGLIFVRYELQQNRLSMQAQTRAIVSQISVENLISMREDDRLIELLSDPEMIRTVADEFRIDMWLLQYARSAENAYYQYQLGLFELEEFESQQLSNQIPFCVPRNMNWWERSKIRFSTSFRDYFDQVLRAECSENGT